MTSRRNWIATGLAAGAFSPQAEADLRNEFPIVRDEVCLNNAHWHPLSSGARAAVNKYLDFKSHGFGVDASLGLHMQKQVRESFASLMGVKPTEIAYVPSTMAGENLVLHGLNFPTGSNIVTDALHFEPSRELYANSGIELRMAPERGGRIPLEELEKRINRNTRLVAISAVSMRNGFQHNLKAVSERAHAMGALVYADIIQAAGAVPINLRDSDVDFAACASYKWLMGDMGVGFLYLKEALQGTVFKRSQIGYRQQGATGAAALVEVGTISNTTIAALTYSLPWLSHMGIDKIEAHRQPLLKKLQAELPSLGFTPMTPQDSPSPIVAFKRTDAIDLRPKLNAAKINIELYEDRVRIAPSVYNTISDVERLIDALRKKS